MHVDEQLSDYEKARNLLGLYEDQKLYLEIQKILKVAERLQNNGVNNSIFYKYVKKKEESNA